MNIYKLRSLLKRTKKSELHVIHYEKNQMIAMNTYSAIIEYQKKSVKDSFSINVFNGTISNDKYPDISNFFIKENYVEVTNIKKGVNKYKQPNYIVDDKYHFDIELVDLVIKAMGQNKNIVHLFDSGLYKFYINSTDGKIIMLVEQFYGGIKAIISGLRID